MASKTHDRTHLVKIIEREHVLRDAQVRNAKRGDRIKGTGA
jgi:hypothetical protein